jgi:uncharacterized protein YbdZ (MbtH family)
VNDETRHSLWPVTYACIAFWALVILGVVQLLAD